jgi:hypothetical protein
MSHVNSGSFLHIESLVRTEDGDSNVNVSLAASDGNNFNRILLKVRDE